MAINCTPVAQCLVGVALCFNIAITTANEAEPKVLVLLAGIPPSTDAVDNTPVFLQEQKGQGCRYYGTLKMTQEAPVSFTEKILALVTKSSAAWKVHIARQICGGVMTDISMILPMPRVWNREFSAGTQVLVR